MYTKIMAVVATIAVAFLVSGCVEKEEDTGDTGVEVSDGGTEEELTNE